MPRVRFTVRSLLIAVALFGLNLAGAITTAKYYPREVIQPGGANDYLFDAEGNLFVHERIIRFPETRPRLLRVLKRPPPPTLIQAWSPVLASVAITLLVLVVPRWNAHQGPLSASSRLAESTASIPSQRLQSAARSTAIGAALIVLNLAAAIYRPPPHPSDPWRRGPFAYGGPWDVTIVYKLDGSVIGYEGRPVPGSPYANSLPVRPEAPGDESRSGRTLPEPHLLQPPTRSPLDKWFPLLASLTITLLVLRVIRRQSHTTMGFTVPTHSLSTDLARS